MLLTRHSIKEKDKHMLKVVKGWKKINHASGDWKQAGVVTLTFEIVDFKPELIREKKNAYFVLVKGINQQQNIMIINFIPPILVFLCT